MVWAQRLFYTVVLCISLVSALGCQLDANIHSHSKLSVPNSPVALTYLRGINIFDLASAGHVVPGIYGTNYTKPNLAFLQNLKNRGLNVVRLPFLWERLQPTLGGALDASYLGYIIEVLKDANSVGLKIILDMHNYGGYNVGGKIGKIDNFIGPTQAQYADVWTKFSTELMSEPEAYAAIYAYDIMNEPASMPDTRNQVPDAGATTLTDFSATVDGFMNGNGDTTVTRSADNGGSLLVSGSPSSTQTYVASVAHKPNINPIKANGLSFRLRGYIPESTVGTAPRLQIRTMKSWATQGVASLQYVDRGYFDISFELPDTGSNWTGFDGLYIEFIVNAPLNTPGPYEFYLYSITQGTKSTGQAPEKLWENISQAAVSAIRANNDEMTLMVEGYDYSSADEWPTNHPTAWITDPKNKTIYQAHQYFDTSAAGTYSQTFAAETADATGSGYTSVSDRAVKRVKNFTDWVTAQNVKGYVGELGWPNSDVVPADSAQWDLVGEAVFAHLDSVEMGATLWATGSWLSPTDNILNSYVASPFQVLSPALVLEAHPGK
jgi:Endoglucanase